MRELILPLLDEAIVSLGTGGPVVRKNPKDLVAGDYLWCFVVSSYRPFVTGHFSFVEIRSAPRIQRKSAVECRWFNQQDGPSVTIPRGWILFGPNGPEKLDKQKHLGLALPGYLHDEMPLAVDFELFSSAFTSKTLTEEAAYFLGAFAMRPQTYVVGDDTWGIFGIRYNVAGEYGIGNATRVPNLRVQHRRHRAALEKLADRLWGRDNYFVEQRGTRLSENDQPVPSGHQPDCLMGTPTSPAGFAVHAPIARKFQLRTEGKPSDPDLRILQYWYSCLTSHLIERTSVSTRKAFLLGALDTISNADSDRLSIGLDWRDGFVGEFPMYSAIHSVGRDLLETFETDETGNPRRTPERTRGRIARCKIWDELQKIGFISEFRFARALDYENTTLARPVFPLGNVLSAVLGVDVLSLAQSTGAGSTENDVEEHRIFVGSGSRSAPFVFVPVREENAYAVSSLPLGHLEPPSPAVVATTAHSKVRLASGGWQNDALEKIGKINSLLSPISDCPPEDLIFEFLVAVLVSQMSGCSEAWVVPRSEDQGVDVGATIDTGAESLGRVRVLFQAKLQSKPVGRRIVDMIRGAFHREKGVLGYVVTNSTFTSQAKQSAERDYPEVRLIDGKEFVSLLLEHKVGLHQSGNGAARRTYLDLTFFHELRQLAAEAKGRSGQIRVQLNDYGSPVFTYS